MSIVLAVECDDCGARIDFVHGMMRGALPEWYIGPGRQLCPSCAEKPTSPTPDDA